MNPQFSMLPKSDIRRSSFKRDFSVKTSLDAGYVVPLFVDEVLPGDTFNLKANLFARLSTPVVPIMDNIHIDTFYFFVPTRLVWEHWEDFISAKNPDGDSVEYMIPQMEISNGRKNTTSYDIGSVADYFGLPTGVTNPPTVSALPFRALNLIWNEWFRDENLMPKFRQVKDDGPDYFYYYREGSDEKIENYPLPPRCKRHDYFTSALPWPQKGPGIDIPISSGTVPVIGNGMSLGLTDGTKNFGLFGYDADSNRVITDISGYGVNVGSVDVGSSRISSNVAVGVTDDAAKSGLVADVSMADPVSINSLRQAFMLQQLLELDARSGSGRYVELLRAHFDTICPDFRLQRPEFLGFDTGMVNIDQVAQTSATDSTTPQGNLAAYGYFSSNDGGFVKSFVEHGFVIGLVSIRADLTYQQGIERMWSRKSRYDFYWPSLAHLGEQAILTKEIYATSEESVDSDGNKVNDLVFGYQERNAEYRYKPSKITGKLRSSAPDSLDVWHLSQKFTRYPVLNSEFIHENPPIDRALAVQDEPQFILDAFFQLNCVRPMPVYGIPGFQSHF